jgi:hypothetical protein
VSHQHLAKTCFNSFFFFLRVVLGIEPKVFCVLGKLYTSELDPLPVIFFFLLICSQAGTEGLLTFDKRAVYKHSLSYTLS